jgi:hypothetical protein
MAESYRNTWLTFKCSGDAAEIFEHNLPTPHYFQRENETLYALGWLISGFFHTGKGVEYLNDIIARILLSMPVLEKIEIEPATRSKPIKLQQLQNAVSLPAALRTRIDTANRYQDTVFWAIKLQAEKYIRVLGGWFPYEELERWAFSVFEAPGDVKDRSTLRAKCRSVWHWYEKRDFNIPERREFTMSRAEAGRSSAAKKAEKTKAKVIAAVAALEFLQEKVNAANVARQASINRKTAAKYLKELENSI